MESFSGLFAPLVTPYTDDGSTVSEVRLARQIRHLIERGVAGFVTCSDTGEFLALSFSERKAVLEITMRECQGRTVFTHISSMNTSTSLDLAQHAGRHGARGAIVMPPYFGRYTDDEIAKFFEAIAAYGNITMIVVDPLSRLNDDLTARIAQLPMTRIAERIPHPIPFPTYSDTFRIDAMVVTPAALLVQEGDLTFIDALISEYGGKRIGKAGLGAAGVEVGGLRAPAMMPPQPVLDQLAKVLGAS